MLDETPTGGSTGEASGESAGQPTAAEPTAERPAKKATAKRAAKKAPAKKVAEGEPGESAAEPAKKTAAKKAPAKKATTKKATTKKTAATSAAEDASTGDGAPAEAPAGDAAAEPTEKPAKKAAAKRATTKKTAAKKTAAAKPEQAAVEEGSGAAVLFQAPEPVRRQRKRAASATAAASTEDAVAEPTASGSDRPGSEGPGSEGPGSEGPEGGDTGAKQGTRKPAAKKKSQQKPDAPQDEKTGGDAAEDTPDDAAGDASDSSDDAGEGGGRRRRRRGGRRRRKPGDGADGGNEGSNDGGNQGGARGDRKADDAGRDSESGGAGGDSDARSEGDEGGEGGTRRRRRRRRTGDDGGDSADDPQNTVTRVRKGRSAEDEITAVSGSTRLEAKKQRRREGREAGRRRAPIVSEAEFLARREAVERVMVVRQRDDLTQIAVLEDKVLVEHYVARESQTSLIGNVYLGRVQNVLPSMEAAFIDIGKGRNAVLYAGEVNWSALGHKDGQPRKIESVLSSGQPILVQVTKDPIGNKGARLTSQISLAGRFLVYVPDGTNSGISRKLPDTERARLKALLKEIVPDSAGVIVRTAAEGASEDELTRDVERLKARWEDIEGKTKGNAPQLLYGEPDLTLKVVRDLFTEDFTKLVIEGDDAWETVQAYVAHVAPDLEDRLERYERPAGTGDSFATYRISEQIAKGLDRKVWLPSGGSLVIDRTEAMTVVDVNTGKFTGSGGNLEETVTKNNLEAAEEIVRQLRLRDIGGIIVVDFIDMVLESNRDLVLRRLVECLGRDRTRHQVAEVTSLGLVQMTRKRIGTGLLESFSENCDHCQGRGLLIHDMPVEPGKGDDDGRRNARRGRGRGGNSGGGNSGGGNSGGGNSGGGNSGGAPSVPSPKDVAAVAKPENAAAAPLDEQPEKPVAEPEPTEPKKPVAEPEPTEPKRTEPERTEPEPTEPEPTESAAPEPPTVVTQTRRRSASRPAGSPAGAATSLQPVAVVVAPTAAAPVDTETPEPPKVVTRTRGRSSSRPAGPAAAADAATDGDGDGDGDDAASSGLQAPVKKKGARKR